MARQYRGAWVAFAREFLTPAEGSALEIDMKRAARAWAELTGAEHALDDARLKLRRGGRGVSRTLTERLERRASQAAAEYRDARELLGETGKRARRAAHTTTQ